MNIPIQKWHGLGNDFLIIDVDKIQDNSIFKEDFVKEICDRHSGIGADGILYMDWDDEDHIMQIVNSDGSYAEMCGNGIRCAAKYLKKKYKMQQKELEILTGIGTDNISKKTVTFTRDGQVKVDMGKVKKYKELTIETPSQKFPLKYTDTFEGFYGDIGNPHFVINQIKGMNTSNFSLEELAKLFGQQIEKHNKFQETNGVNVHFVDIINSSNLKMRTWERGSGYTLACGTGASTAVYCLQEVALLNKDRPINVQLPKGNLLIERNKNNNMLMTGPAEHVCNIDYEV